MSKQVVPTNKVNKIFAEVYYRYSELCNTDPLTSYYKKPSSNKIWAYDQCKAYCKELGGHDVKVLGTSCHAFSVGFETPDVFVYITKDYTRIFDLKKIKMLSSYYMTHRLCQ